MKLIGYAAVFYDPRDPGTEYQLTPSIRERIDSRAFDRTLKGQDDVVAAFNHNLDYLLGRRSAGTLKLEKDARGLRYEITYDESDPQHVTVAAKIKRGDLIGSSFSFATIKDDTTSTKDGYIRTVQDVRLFEVGPVWAAAYPSTTTAVRSNATPGSVRWLAENPEARRRHERLQQVERSMMIDRRLDQLRRQEILDRVMLVTHS